MYKFERTFPALSTQIKDEHGKLRTFINIYINDEDIRSLGGDAYALQDGDQVMLIPVMLIPRLRAVMAFSLPNYQENCRLIIFAPSNEKLSMALS